MKPRRGLILFIGLALALIAMIMLGRAAYQLAQYRLSWLDFGPRIALADFVEEDYMGSAPPPIETLNDYANCNNDYWGTGNKVCDAAGFAQDHDFFLTGVRMYDIRCDIANAASEDFFVQVINNSTGEVLAESAVTGVACMALPGVIAHDDIPIDFSFVTPFEVATGITYAYSFRTNTGDVTDPVWASGSFVGIFGAAFLSGAAPGGAAPTISMYFPGETTATSSIPEFRNWLVDGTNLLSNGTIQVFYSQATSSLGAAPPEGFVDSKNGGLGARNQVTKTHQLWFPPMTTTSIWYAQALYTSPDQLDQAASAIQRFSVTPQGSLPSFASSTYVTPYHAYFSTSTTAGVALCSNATGGFLDDPIGNIVDAMCAAFNPDPVALQSYSQLGEDLSTRPPFGYFGAVKAGLAGIAATSSALAFITPSSTAAFAGVFTPVRTGFSLIIAILAGFWIWNRIRHFEP